MSARPNQPFTPSCFFIHSFSVLLSNVVCCFLAVGCCLTMCYDSRIIFSFVCLIDLAWPVHICATQAFDGTWPTGRLGSMNEASTTTFRCLSTRYNIITHTLHIQQKPGHFRASGPSLPSLLPSPPPLCSITHQHQYYVVYLCCELHSTHHPPYCWEIVLPSSLCKIFMCIASVYDVCVCVCGKSFIRRHRSTFYFIERCFSHKTYANLVHMRYQILCYVGNGRELKYNMKLLVVVYY